MKMEVFNIKFNLVFIGYNLASIFYYLFIRPDAIMTIISIFCLMAHYTFAKASATRLKFLRKQEEERKQSNG